MNTAIISTRNYFRSKCKTCKGTGSSDCYLDKHQLRKWVACLDCGTKIKEITRLIMAGLPKTYLHIRHISKHLDKMDQEFVKSLEKDIKEDPERMRFVCLASPYKGVGKTGSLAYIVSRYVEILFNHYPHMEVMPVTWVSSSFLVNHIYQTIGIEKKSKEVQEKNKAFMDSVFMNPILIIDGLGDHHVRAGISGDEQFITNKIHDIFRYKMETGGSIFATSNYPIFHQEGEIITGGGSGMKNESPPTILDKYGERFVGIWQREDFIWYEWKTEEGVRMKENKPNKTFDKFRKKF